MSSAFSLDNRVRLDYNKTMKTTQTHQWMVFLQVAQCSCGNVRFVWPGHEDCPKCEKCGSDDEPSLLELEALVSLDHHGEICGDILLQHGYTYGEGLLGGQVVLDLDEDLEKWLIEEATEARELRLLPV